MKPSVLTMLRFSLFLIIICLIFPVTSKSADVIEIDREFNLFTSKNLQGYTKPLFTTIEESLNSYYYTTAIYKEKWTLAVDVSVCEMIIPGSQKSYTAELPHAFGDESVVHTAKYVGGNITTNVGTTISQPTIYGKSSTSVFSAPQVPNRETYDDDQGYGVPDSIYKSVAFMEGNNVTFMAGLPVFQLISGFPTRTQLRIRYLPIPMLDEMGYYLGFNVNQQIDHFFDIFKSEDMMGLAVNMSFWKINWGKSIDMNSFATGVHYSKGWENGFTYYAGIQYEYMSGEFYAVKTSETDNETDIVNSPYLEIRQGKDIKFDLESFTSFRILNGLSYRTSFLELHTDIAYASQPVFTIGATFWIGEWGDYGKKQEKIERYEKIERIERVVPDEE